MARDLSPYNHVASSILSNDGTLSESALSESAFTAMTSLVDTDEDLDKACGSQYEAGHQVMLNEHVLYEHVPDEHVPDERVPDEQDDFPDDTASVYAKSHYPRAPSPHGTAMVFFNDTKRAGSDFAASTRSLWVPDLDYRDIHGRRYCGDYYMPNDEIEQLRLSLQHQVFLHLLGGEVTCVPLNDPKFILDVGTGTGEWPIRMAELYPNCEVVGTDISAIAETQCVPMNVFFEVEDAEEWDRPLNHYDHIHFRCMEGSFRDWRFIYDSVYDSLKPGGWVELIDFDSLESVKIWFTAFSEGSPIFDMAQDLEVAAEKVGRKRGIVHMDPQLFKEAGFTDIQVVEHAIPMKVGEKSAGKLWLISCLDALEANCLRLLTQQMDWDPEKCKVACEQAARELANLAKDPEKAKGLLVKAKTLIARKPLDARPSTHGTRRATRSPSAELLQESRQRGVSSMSEAMHACSAPEANP